eukprot:15364930-Alexandrium_andersonii.AAC.1
MANHLGAPPPNLQYLPRPLPLGLQPTPPPGSSGAGCGYQGGRRAPGGGDVWEPRGVNHSQ